MDKIIAVIAVLYLIKQFLWPYYRPVGKIQKSRVRKYSKEKQAEEVKRRRREKKLQFAKTFAVRLPIMQSEASLKKTLDRLDSDKKPEEIWLEQDLWLLGGIIVAMILFSANTFLGLLAVMMVPMLFLLPTDELDKEVKRRNRNVALDFPQFYSMVFYQYAKSINVFLADIINDYLPNANDDMAVELNVMLQNIDYADEEYALKQLKRRVPVHHVIKFCDIMETRLRGYDNVSQMQYLKNEIDRYRVTELENELHKRVRTNNLIQLTLIIILILYVVLYYLFMIMGQLKIFM
jgi:Flp pilus assembly protein TadB